MITRLGAAGLLNYNNLDLKVAWYNWKEILILWCKAVVRVVRLEW